MDELTVYDAITRIDGELIDRSLNRKPAPRAIENLKKAGICIGAVCLAAVLLFAVAAGVSSIIKRNNDKARSGIVRDMSFEDCLEYTTDVVLAKCRGEVLFSGVHEYRFTVETSYFSVYEQAAEREIRVIDYGRLYGGFRTGQEYVLLLERRPRVLLDRDTYLTIPVTVDRDNIAGSTVQGKPLAQKTVLELTQLDGFGALLDYMSDRIRDTNTGYCRDYIRSDDLKEIALKTEYLAKVTVLDVSTKTYKNDSGAELYACRVETVYKGGLVSGAEVLIWLPDGKVRAGETYTLAFMVYAPGSDYLSLSAKRNFFSDSEAEAMKAYCAS